MTGQTKGAVIFQNYCSPFLEEITSKNIRLLVQFVILQIRDDIRYAEVFLSALGLSGFTVGVHYYYQPAVGQITVYMCNDSTWSEL